MNENESRDNFDPATVAGFGLEWSTYDQEALPVAELNAHFDAYFHNFPWSALPVDAEGFDLGCGSGRWAKLVAERVHRLHCIDASADALAVARRKLRDRTNCEFRLESVEELGLLDDSMDFGYSLGVLHHVPDTIRGLRSCVRKLKLGAPFLLYLYYRFDNRPAWFRALWRASDFLRRRISKLPPQPKLQVTKAIASAVYLPLARTAALIELLGIDPERFPLSFYRNASFYTMQTDALDRFGTRLEHRFTRAEVGAMMKSAGLERITFNEHAPYWCAVGFRSR